MIDWWIECGDSASLLKLVPDHSVDALVTDPPAGIAFMGAEWDKDKGGRSQWIAWLASILNECRRTMKPGAYGWVWALPRTSHWTATACEDAGFAVRDVMTHVFGTGFPKSRSLLKPAAEHWILIKAPGELRELRIEECRIDGVPSIPGSIRDVRHLDASENKTGYHLIPAPEPPSGRWPANFALSHSDECAEKCVDCPVALLDRQSGYTTSPGKTVRGEGGKHGRYGAVGAQGIIERPSDSGGASRFFYTSKPSTSERNNGLSERNPHPTVKSTSLMRHLVKLVASPGSLILDPFAGSGSTGLASIEEGCFFVGIEREPHFADIARQRMANASKQGRLF